MKTLFVEYIFQDGTTVKVDENKPNGMNHEGAMKIMQQLHGDVQKILYVTKKTLTDVKRYDRIITERK